jgi:hypothetical protein
MTAPLVLARHVQAHRPWITKATLGNMFQLELVKL